MPPIEFKKAVRGAVPLLLGIVGPSGTGKTFSALRLAKGMQRVIGGRIKVVDTEHGRAKQYADYFDFDYFPFDPPSSSLRYLEVIKAAAEIPGPTVVDSMSHEHEGPGGYIDLHDQEVKRLLTCGFRSEFAASVPAWAVPAKHRQQLINGIVTSGFNGIFCFRAKEKVDMNAKKLDRDGNPTGDKTVGNLGWMPIAGDAFVYEMTAKCLLLPGANGIPTWNPEFPGEKNMAKIPIFFQEIFSRPEQLSEDIGEKLAAWAAGSNVTLSKEWYAKCNHDQFDELEKIRAARWSSLGESAKKAAKAWSDEAKARLGARPASTPPQADPADEQHGQPGSKRNPDYIPGVSLPEEEFLS